MRAREITISGAPVFTFELSLLRVPARHPRVVCVIELVRGFAVASLSWRRCTAATPNMTAYCGRQQSTSGDILASPRRGACLPLECATGRRTSCVDHWPKAPNAIIFILSKTHIPRVVASRINVLSTELPPPPFPIMVHLK